MASTSAVHQNAQELIEDASALPTTMYGLSKLAGEIVATHCCRTRKIPTVILRYAYPYGSDTNNPIDYMTGQIKGVLEGREFPLEKGYCRQQPLFEDDLGRISIKALDYARVPPEIFLISGTEVIPQEEVLGKIGEVFGKAANVTGSTSVADKRTIKVEKMTKLLGEPEVELAQGLRRIRERMK